MNFTVRTTLLAVLASLALACDRPKDLPDMGVSRTALSFQAPGGSGEPVAQTIFVVNTGRGSLDRPTPAIAYTDGAGWLAATVTGDGAPYPVAVQATSAGLMPGDYRATLTLACANASSSPTQVDVTLTVPDPRFVLSTEALAIVAPRGGGDPEAATFQVLNAGRGTLPVPEITTSYVGPTGWLSTVVSGTPDAYTVAVSAHVAGFDSGVYTATMSISAPSAEGPPRTLAVTLTVPPAELALSSSEVLVDGPADGSNPAPVELTVTNPGGGLLARPSAEVVYGSSGTEPTWLAAEVLGTEAPYVLSIQPMQARPYPALEPGTYTASVRVSSPDAANPPQSVAVTFVVPKPRILVSYPGNVFLMGTEGCPPPLTPGTIGVVVSGPGTPPPRPTATVAPEDVSWIEAKVVGDAPYYSLVVKWKAAPPGGRDGAVVLDTPGAVSPVTVLVMFREFYAVDPPTASFEYGSLTIRGQLGAGDPGPTWIRVNTSPGCVGTPAATVTYAAGDPAWITTEVVAGYKAKDVWIHGSMDGMAAGASRQATVGITVPEVSASTSPFVTLFAGTLGPTTAMSAARRGHSVTPMSVWSSIGGARFRADGALVAGGLAGDGGTTSVDHYDEHGSRFWLVPSLPRWRHSHGAAVMGERVLLCGGVTSSGPDATCDEVYFGNRWPPYTWTAGPSIFALAFPRVRPTLIPLDYNTLLAASPDHPPEVTDYLGVSSVASGVSGAAAVKLRDGRVLVAGGGTGAWIYDPDYREWLPTGAMSVERPLPALLLLADGRVLALGGAAGIGSAEIWDPATGLWTPTTPAPSGHVSGDAAVLSNGKVVAVSGYVAGAGYSAEVELFDPQLETWSIAGTLPSARAGLVPSVLANGLLLLAGGELAATSTPTAEAFTW